MQIRNRKKANDKIELQMTPMIDIVFQLLVFFVMTFKIVAQEGDFNIRMPRQAPNQTNVAPEFPASILTLTADENGTLTSIVWNDNQTFESFDELHRHVISYVGDSVETREAAEVEIIADFDLRYEYVVQAITSVSGYRTPDDQIVKLIEKINFKPPAGE